MNTSPFDLERALAGDPVVMRNGKNIKKVYLLDCMPDNVRRVVGVTESDMIHITYDNGKENRDDDRTHCFDLFMLEETKTYWVNAYITSDGRSYTGKVFKSEEEAKKNTNEMFVSEGGRHKTISFEI